MSDPIYIWNKRAPAWGPGVIVKQAHDGKKVEALFEEAGRKKLLTRVAQLEQLAPEDIAEGSPLLDENRWQELDSKAAFKANFEKMVERFLEIFPEGFADPAYAEGEREYKIAAVKTAQKTLSADALEPLMEAEDYKGVFDRALKAMKATNLVHPRWEQAKVRAIKADKHKAFATELHEYLHGATPVEQRVERFAWFLADHDLGNWPVSTYWGFVFDPENRPFVRPMATKYAADALSRDIKYESKPCADCYSHIATLYADVAAALTEAGHPAKDAVDIQGFLWIGSGLGYKSHGK